MSIAKRGEKRAIKMVTWRGILKISWLSRRERVCSIRSPKWRAVARGREPGAHGAGGSIQILAINLRLDDGGGERLRGRGVAGKPDRGGTADRAAEAWLSDGVDNCWR